MRHGGKRHWAAPFVLAMLCLRAFVPAGFMLAPVDGRLQVVLCDSDAPGLPVHHHGSAEHSGHQHGNAEHSGHQHTQLDPTCPYAQSAGPAPLPVLPQVASYSELVVLVLPLPVEQTRIQFGPARRQFARGPPHFA